VKQHLPQQEIQKSSLSVQASSSSNSDVLQVATVAQKIMTDLNEAVSEKDKILAIRTMVLNERNGCWSLPLEVIAFVANGIWRQLSELSKQLQD
jgi:hypothetical protein